MRKKNLMKFFLTKLDGINEFNNFETSMIQLKTKVELEN